MPMRDRTRRVLPSGLTGLAGLACAVCCAIPVLLAAGVVSGAGWAIAGAWMPGVALALAALAGAVWWWSRRLDTPAVPAAKATALRRAGHVRPGENVTCDGRGRSEGD